MTAKQLMETTFLTRIEGEEKGPQYPGSPEGEYFCPNGNCPVQEVRIRLVLDDQCDQLPRLLCPCCRSRLALDGWVYENVVKKEGGAA